MISPVARGHRPPADCINAACSPESTGGAVSQSCRARRGRAGDL